jgi:4'-phosphopantetheinyl transferase
LQDNIQFDDFSSGFPGNVDLKKTETHVIRASLLLSATTITRLSAILSLDEHERAASFHFAKHRRRFIASRGLLRSILGTYLGAAPNNLRFIYGSNGKPRLDMGKHTGDVEFNVSHSEDLALYAIAPDVPIGVDVECVSWQADLDKIARNFFSSAAYGVYAKLPQEEKTEAFFRCWTHQEAFIKAIGEGLAYPLDRFDVSIGGRAQVLSLGGDPARASEWSIHHLSPAEGFIGALAIRGKGSVVRGFTYEGVS